MIKKLLVNVDFSILENCGWTWVREESEAWNCDQDTLRIASLPGTLWEGNNSAKNVAFYSLIECADGICINATVKNNPKRNGEQGGLLLYSDDDNYVKLVKELVNDEHVVVLAKEVQGVGKVLATMKVASDIVNLQLQIRDTIVTAQFQDAANERWHDMGSFSGIILQSIRPGLCVHGGDQLELRWTEFSNMRIMEIKG